MDIRKEQALLAVVVVGLGLMAVFGESSAVPTGRLQPKAREFKERTAVRTVLAPTPPAVARTAAPARDLFREPSEESPLPPKVLVPPRLAGGPVVAVPLTPGPAAILFHLLRQDADKGVEHAFKGAGEAGGDTGGPKEAGNAKEASDAKGSDPKSTDTKGSGAKSSDTKGSGTSASLAQGKPEQGKPDARPDAGAGKAAPGGAGDPRFRFDRLKSKSDPKAQWGQILNKNKVQLRVQLERKQLAEPIRFQWWLVDASDPKKDKPMSGEPIVVPPGEVEELELADTLPNRMELGEARLGRTVADLPARERHVLWLLDEARTAPQAFARAEASARVFIEIEPKDGKGYQLLGRVFRESGRLKEELELYQSLRKEGAHREAPFVLRGLASLETRLGLRRDAEEHYRLAVSSSSGDPAANRDLALFLLERGQLDAARRYAEAASRNAPSEGPELMETRLAVFQVLLGCGDLRGAQAELQRIKTLAGEGGSGRVDLLEGTLAYASRDLTAAAAAFAKAVATEQSTATAGIGLGSTQTFLGRFDEAKTTLADAATADPLLRQRALAAQGLLLEWTRNRAEALAMLEAAYHVDPTDLYVLYLLGRERRLNGQFEEATSALKAALRHQHDLVEVLGELALVHLDESEAGTGDTIEHLAAAAQYARKAVEFEGTRGKNPWYPELLGLVALRRLDAAGAREALQLAVQWGQSPFAKACLPLLDYRENRVQDSLNALEILQQETAYPEPYKTYVAGVVAEIKDHRDKVEVRDRFQRSEQGNRWVAQVLGNEDVRMTLIDGRVRFAGNFKLGNRPAALHRSEENGRERFLSAAVDVLPAGASRSRWVALEISNEVDNTRGNVESDFKARLGLYRGGVWYQLQDGPAAQASDPKNLEPVMLLDKAPDKVRVEIELTRSGSRKEDTTLLFRVDGEVKKAVPIKRWSSVKKNLRVSLLAEGEPGDKIDAAFDEFQLVKRRS